MYTKHSCESSVLIQAEMEKARVEQVRVFVELFARLSRLKRAIFDRLRRKSALLQKLRCVRSASFFDFMPVSSFPMQTHVT